MKTVTLRNVPEALRDKLAARAAAAGLSLSDYLLVLCRQIAERPTEREIQMRTAKAKSRLKAGRSR